MDLAAAKSQLNITPVDYSYRMPVEFFGKFDNDTGKRLTPRIGTNSSSVTSMFRNRLCGGL